MKSFFANNPTSTVPSRETLWKQMDMAKVALITGVTGQDGSYLSEFLLEKGIVK